MCILHFVCLLVVDWLTTEAKLNFSSNFLNFYCVCKRICNPYAHFRLSHFVCKLIVSLLFAKFSIEFWKFCGARTSSVFGLRARIKAYAKLGLHERKSNVESKTNKRKANPFSYADDRTVCCSMCAVCCLMVTVHVSLLSNECAKNLKQNKKKSAPVIITCSSLLTNLTHDWIAGDYFVCIK